jgi:protocatechuate 3,4-dioxygenase beta subunit
MESCKLSRRDTLLRCAALGALKLAPRLGLAGAADVLEAQERGGSKRPTQWNEIGPFYKRSAPSQASMRQADDPGFPLTVSGAIFGTSGEALPDAKIEIWQANHEGLYDLDGYLFRATLATDDEGRYSFDSVMPGHYPARVCQHIHYRVIAPGHAPMITQLCFATDPVFEGDPNRNFSRDPLAISSELVRPVTLGGDSAAVEASVEFEVVLKRL